MVALSSPILGPLDPRNVNRLRKSELQDVCRQLNLSDGGTVFELKQRLQEYREVSKKSIGEDEAEVSTTSPFYDLNRSQLQDLCTKLNISNGGTVFELKQRLNEYYSNQYNKGSDKLPTQSEVPTTSKLQEEKGSDKLPATSELPKQVEVPERVVQFPASPFLDLNRLRKTELQDLSTELNLSTSGTVSELKQQINDYYKKLAEQHEDKDKVEPEADTTTVKTRKKKKKWLVTDPAEITPHYYHQDLFRANFPLVEIVEVQEGCQFPVPNKFEGPVLNQQVTLDARRKWIRRMFTANGTYKVPEIEKQAFARHFAFLEPIKSFTRPSRADLERHNVISKKKRRYEDVKDIGRPKKVRKINLEENHGMYIVAEAEQGIELFGPSGSGGDYTGFEFEFSSDLIEDEDIPTGFADAVLHIYNDSMSDPDKVVGIVERKFAEDKLKWNARFQGAFYAAKHCLDNLQKGHGSAVYVLVFAHSTWSFGILVPEGYVQIRNGTVDKKSQTLFETHQEITGQRTASFPELQGKLKDGTEFYRRCYGDKPTALYKDGPMLAGKLYLCSTWYNLPRPQIGGGNDEAGRILFDGLLRLVIGDSVMDMSKDDFAERMRIWNEMENELVDSWFHGCT